jgi:hypothetical protein
MFMTDESGGPDRKATNAEGLAIGGAGIVIAWGTLLVGTAAGFGVAALCGGSFSADRIGVLTGDVLPGLALLYAMAGFLIEMLRIQGTPRPGRSFRAWKAAGRLRLSLYALLALVALGIGFGVTMV